MKQLQTTLPGLVSAVQAADSGSFSAAAKVLNLTPAAVSKNVATLEAILQLRLFNRTTRQLSLTEEGNAFIAQTRVGLDALELAGMQATRGLKPQGLVRVSCPVGFGRRYVLPSLPAFYARYPQVQIELTLNDQAVDLVREGFDVGIRGGSQPPEGMVARKICDIPSVLVASPRYLKLRGTPKRPEDLLNHDLLKVKFLNGRVLPWLFKENVNGKNKVVSFEGPAKLLISDPEVMLDATLLHLGIGRLGRHHAHHALIRGDLIEVLARQQVPNEASMSVFYPHRAGLAPRVRVLVDFLLVAFAENESLQEAGVKRSAVQKNTGGKKQVIQKR
jgi:DNA-binding transcriptional LysR family regulator